MDLKINLLYMVFICTVISFIFTVIIYYNRSNDRHTFYKKNKWILKPAIIMNQLYNNIFGRTDGRFNTLFSFRSVIVSIGISISANIVFALIIYFDRPIYMKEYELNTLAMFYFTFMFFNALGDIVSIAFSRSVLYQITHKKGNVNKYILKDLFGIFLGYFITMSPIIIVSVLSYLDIMMDEQITKVLKMGIYGIIFVPFMYLIFLASKTYFIYKVLAFFAICSIAIPTIFFVFIIIIVYLLKKENVEQYTINLNSKMTQLCKYIIYFCTFLILILDMVKEMNL